MQAPGASRLAVDAIEARYGPRLVSIGTDFRQADIRLRERLSLTGEMLPVAVAQLRAVADEGLILSTCNRTEIYAVIAAPCPEVAGIEIRDILENVCGLPADDIRRLTTLRHGQEAIRHLLRVACGLESLVMGEPQILGQIRTSLATAHDSALTGPVLSRLATDALCAGKRARTATGIARNRLSIPHAAVEIAGEILGGLAGRAVLVVGTGEMGTLLAKLLRAAGVGDLAIANRTAERADALAAATGGRAIRLTAVADALTNVEVVFAATGVSPGRFIIPADVLDHLLDGGDRPLLIDLGVPRTIDPELARRPGVRLVDVDDLQAIASDLRAAFGREIAEAEALVEAATAAFLDWWAARNAAPAISALREHAEAIRAAELARALARLGNLSARDREVVAALSVAVTNKLLHGPVTRLRDAGEQHRAIAAARTLFGIDSAAETSANERHHAGSDPFAVPPATGREQRRRIA